MLTNFHRSRRWATCWIWTRYPVNRSKFDASQNILCISQSVKIVLSKNGLTRAVLWSTGCVDGRDTQFKINPELSKLANAYLSRDNTLLIAKSDSTLVVVFDYNYPCLGQFPRDSIFGIIQAKT